MDSAPPRDAQWFRALGYTALTAIAATYLVKLPLEIFWSVPEDGTMPISWLLAGIVLLPGCGVTAALAIVAASALRTLGDRDNGRTRRA